jgi:signal transduction histidine kinase
MNAMNQLNSATLINKARFVMKRECFGDLSFPNQSNCKGMQNDMTHYPKLSTPPERAAVFIGHQPQMLFSVARADHATLRLAAQQDERKRIAQELHDTLLQGFTSVALKLDALTGSLPPALSKTREQLQKMLEQMDQYLAEARRSIYSLRSTTLENAENFSKALVKVSERALEGTAIALSFTVQGAERKLTSVFEDNLLRVCEEAVANAVKHARPTRVEVALEFGHKQVQLRIRDNGCGFHPARPEASKVGHFGLLGMQERVEALSGTLSIDSAPGRGTCLRVTVPTDETQGHSSVALREL